MDAPAFPGFTLRPLRLDDAAAWADYICLPEVTRHTSITAANVDDVRREIERTLTGEPGAPLRFAIVEDGRATIVATVGFHGISTAFGTAEIAYDVAPSHWRRGIATAACRAATRWGFEHRGWQRIQATTVPANLGSQGVLARCGYRREGLLRNDRRVRGQPADYWMYAAIPGDVAAAGDGD